MAASLNIVVVEDHDALREVTVEALRGMGYGVQGVDCAEALSDELKSLSVDLMVIDLNLPGEDGISLAQRVCAVQPEVGIIMVTSRGQVNDKLLGYESGADIYLTKPTSVEEHGAAVKALARRLKSGIQHDFVLDSTTLLLQGPDHSVNLSSKEAMIICAFARALEHRLAYWQLMELSKSDSISKSTLEVQIVRLRKKLLQAGTPNQPIKAIRNEGYQLCIDIAVI